MKTVQDWGFISKDQGLVKPKLQDNKIFHALTSAYENNQQQEIYGATENIVRREKELCEMALADLKRLSEGKGETDATIKLIMDHYQSRLGVAREKEEKINHLSEDSRKMTEEYKKKTQELADVKRNLMESQGKLRELAKTTEKLLKREEELRFIESNLRTEIDKNKRNIINGLYEIVADLPETAPLPIAIPASVPTAIENQVTAQVDSRPAAMESKPHSPPTASTYEKTEMPAMPGLEEHGADKRPFYQGLFRPASEPAHGSMEGKVETLAPKESAWHRDEGGAPVRSPFTMPRDQAEVPAPAHTAPVQHVPVLLKPGDLHEKAVRLKMFEPGKSLCSKSMVKTAEGEVVSEYFYSPLHMKDTRHYIFNTLFALSSLLNLRTKDEEQFQDRLETLFTDLLSRLEHSHNIHLESFIGEELNRDIMDRMLSLPRRERPAFFEVMATKVLSRIESVGQARAGLIDQQFRNMPKSDFPPGKGIAA